MQGFNSSLKEIIRFVFVGVINTLVGSGLMFLLYNAFHVNYWISSVSNYVAGSIVSYFLNKYFTFRKKSYSFKEVVYFILNICACYCLSYGVARPFTRYLLRGFATNIQDNVAMLIGMVVFTVLNFIGQKFLVFRKDKKKNE